MSVLTCPVCQGAMKEVSRNGLLIDTCTQCRGVWLDRGELEKLASIVTESEPIATSVDGHAQAAVVMPDTGSAHSALDLPASRVRDNGVEPRRCFGAVALAA